MATATAVSPRDPATRRDRRPRTQQGDKAPRSNDYPKDVEGATDYVIKGIPPDMLAQFKVRAERENRSMRWLLLRFIEKYGRDQVAV
jgi:hypothetical protein